MTPASTVYEDIRCDDCGKDALSFTDEREGVYITLRKTCVACPWCGQASGTNDTTGARLDAAEVWKVLFARHKVDNLSDLKRVLLREGVTAEESEECPACGTLSLLLSSHCHDCGATLPLYAKFCSENNLSYRGVRPWQDTKVTIGGLDLPLRLDLAAHSPTGFEWGYSGSGPHQLALAMAADCLTCYLPEKKTAERLAANRYSLLLRTVANLPKEAWEIDRKTVFSILSAK